MTAAPLTETEVIELITLHLGRMFPKACGNCGHVFQSPREYVQLTQPIGSVHCLDAEIGDWDTAQPLGTLAFANCRCGSTLALSTADLPLPQRRALLSWLKSEIDRLGSSVAGVMDRVRLAVRGAAAAGA